MTDNNDGLPIPGVIVSVIGATIATQTNLEGLYSIAVPANAVLRFTFIGMKPVEKLVGKSTQLM